MTTEHDYCIVLSTTANEQNRDQIIKGLLEAKLAACIQTMPIESHYVWKGEICNDTEWLLVIKTRRELYELVEEKIENLHEYEVAQIVQVPIVDGFNPYLEWLRESTLSRH
ncbi:MULTISPECIES: divalent-cation tolerance protein CutA [Vibrio]|jgi:periplasmic divalent cation tolerance protein|uniref:Cytochrome C biogenesis protein n=1 Tax=Vibrio natriegens NBRC 15636 = ATCC 14048 = DSM 759 TaxID=1219067 RepID=A0AAN0Y618_VIBNA|nr:MULTISPECIES: divalent-cation tolerance protein CutA [Vibrio]CAH0528280.1 Divalent-cation tolerance protein CutA [Catenococcus thiocycli]AEX24406.1 periplasmic divalent cation tolerance protein cutA [Vibrio sp. EJY3]ALR18348.1 cytochrome C biogenesis protein [Vibrio natriegens NBRC 15636 = ATCC 14048 = DSM 759]ANQ14297.1 cytochrome C biogenesis protein [Vibrio natriegens NBRC 15636 = ATCC 14048 = DSM 759]ANQ19449.1 cytochrome C biogenesis protein [Vibrio natriegens]